MPCTTDIHPRRSRRPVVLASVALAASAAAVGGAGALSGAAGAANPSAAGTAKAVVAATRAAILSQSAVRVTSTARSTTTHKVTETAVFDAGRHTSRQRYATTSPAARVAILVTPTDVFFSGDRTGLTTLFAMPASDASKVGTRWVDITSHEAQYKDFSTAVLSSLPHVFLPGTTAKHLRLSTTSSHGARVHVLSWTATGTTGTDRYQLWVPVAGRSLPLQEVQLQGTTRQLSVFGHWNERLAVPRPKRTIAFSSLLGG